MNAEDARKYDEVMNGKSARLNALLMEIKRLISIGGKNKEIGPGYYDLIPDLESLGYFVEKSLWHGEAYSFWNLYVCWDSAERARLLSTENQTASGFWPFRNTMRDYNGCLKIK